MKLRNIQYGKMLRVEEGQNTSGLGQRSSGSRSLAIFLMLVCLCLSVYLFVCRDTQLGKFDYYCEIS